MGAEVDYEQQTAEMKFWWQWLDSDYTISYNESISQLTVRNLYEQDYTGYVKDNRITQLWAKYKPHRRNTLGEQRKRGREDL